jgi:hypothetical protein
LLPSRREIGESSFCSMAYFRGSMSKKAISSTDLIYLFHEKLKESTDCPASGLSIAIVPAPDVGWTVLISPRQRAKLPLCAKWVQAIQKQFREMYVLKS